VVPVFELSRHKVSESLKERVKRAGLEAKFRELPGDDEEGWKCARLKSASPPQVLPGLVLVKMAMYEDTWHGQRVPKVLGFIGGTSDKPEASTDKGSDVDLRRVEEGVAKAMPKVLFEPGGWCGSPPGRSTTSRRGRSGIRKEPMHGGGADPGRSTPVSGFSQVEKG